MAEETPSPTRLGPAHHEIASLNDWLRFNLTSPGSKRVLMTAGIAKPIGDVALIRALRKRAELLRTIRDFDAFDLENDRTGTGILGCSGSKRSRPPGRSNVMTAISPSAPTILPIRV